MKKQMKLLDNLNLFRINITAYSEEDFLILTDLTEKEIRYSILHMYKLDYHQLPYDNDMLIDNLLDDFPNNIVVKYSIDFNNIDIEI